MLLSLKKVDFFLFKCHNYKKNIVLIEKNIVLIEISAHLQAYLPNSPVFSHKVHHIRRSRSIDPLNNIP